MLSNLSMLKCRVNDRDYQFLCDSNSPIFEIKESLFQFQKFIGKIEDDVNERVKASEKVIDPNENFCCSQPEISMIDEENNG